MCLTLPNVLVTVLGIEKLIPTFADLEVFLQLLPRSSTAERMNPYTSMWTGITPGDGPQHFHLILLDNGQVAATGAPAAVIQSDILARVYGCPLEVRYSNGRWSIHVHPSAWEGLLES